MGTLSINERPMCPVCKHRMGLARISPGNRGYEDRTFECVTCHRMEKVTFAIQPASPAAGLRTSRRVPFCFQPIGPAHSGELHVLPE